ncbi:hypothetical protein BJ508DRAFT_240513 [Ascobolus immersus RN42]|uniref:U3 small nucleolar ribonucleoprotein protein IMP3 n=1 Tax=Ascobolus immersus RN42 TaxID=1160509 RepID=A0A3N4I0M0_ASCIM|nr:hypothetical protein BJ508DRAFT_240513 [Ascobolus immersus RN42]
MVRQLKHHEQKLLRKVDFLSYPSDQNHREAAVSRRYHLQNPSDYTKYNRLSGSIRQLAHRLSLLPPTDAYRRKHEELLLEKLYNMGLLKSKSKMSEIEKLSVSCFCRRRLAVVMVRGGMVQGGGIKDAVKFIEQGHVRVGTEVVTDPAFLVTRGLEDFVTWVDGSKIKANIMKYRDEVDDYDLL